MCNNSKRNVLKKRSLYAINDNDCFKQWSQIVGLKRCGGKMWRSISFQLFIFNMFHFGEQNIKDSVKMNYRESLEYMLCTNLIIIKFFFFQKWFFKKCLSINLFTCLYPFCYILLIVCQGWSIWMFGKS